ncbi:Hypothetical protein POVN_LOCUS171 [uncultured virus]|nr:Hypothetical protein POVN_LOCUS171 [uncultured virus]
MTEHQKSDSRTHKSQPKLESKGEALNGLAVLSPNEAILYIWKNLVRAGDKVFVAFAGENRAQSVEGVVKKIYLDEGLVEIINPAGPFFFPLLDAWYVQLLCVAEPKCKKDVVGSCSYHDGPLVNIWKHICIGSVVHVDIAGHFEAFVEEINLKHRFVGFRTASGLTYAPIANIANVHVIDPLTQSKKEDKPYKRDDKEDKPRKDYKPSKRDEESEEESEHDE